LSDVKADIAAAVAPPNDSAERLKQELDYLHFALDASGQGVWEYDGASNHWSFSPAWKRMRGIPEDEDYTADDDGWLDKIHPEDHVMVRDAMARQYAGEMDDVSFEYRERHRNGHWIWILARGRCVSGHGDGKPLRIIGTDIDITALRNSQQALDRLKRSEERWKEAVNSAEQGIWDFDQATGENYCSPSWLAMRGLPVDKPPLEVEQWLAGIHSDDREAVRSCIDQQAAGTIRHISMEYREWHRAGYWIWILARGHAVGFDAEGKATRYVGTDTEITALKQRQTEFETLSQRLKLALATSAIGIWEFDLASRVTCWDKRTAELFGLDAVGEVCILPGIWEAAIHADDRDMAVAVTEACIASGRTFSFDYRITMPDGSLRHMRCRCSTMREPGGRGKMIGVNWDISDDIARTETIRLAKRLAEERSQQLEEARQSLEYSALHDALTSLPNRRYVDRILAELSNSALRSRSITLLNIDLDRFKQINDTKGHAAGDALLIHMARQLKACVRDIDIVARIGGDEFVIIMAPPPPSAGLQQIVNRIIEAAARPMAWNGYECRSGVSIGIAESSPGVDARQLLINADIALYRSKRAGRNRAAYYTAALQAEIIANKQCADDILQGLDRNEFEPFFQPQVDAHTFEIIGMEALVRWRHPQRGLLTPESFIPVANDLHALGTIDRIVLEKSVAHMFDWEEDGVSVPLVSVNVSARRLGDDVLFDNLAALRIDPSRVSFELVESIFLDNRNDILSANVKRLKDMGFKIELDDFGTGHASIVSLLNINPHRLKIDRQLVRPVVESEAQRRLVRSIIEIGKSQGISVCAEGVETAQHVDILRDLGCDSLQGYYFGRPMPASEVVRFVTERSWVSRYFEESRSGGVDSAVLREFMRQNGLKLPKAG